MQKLWNILQPGSAPNSTAQAWWQDGVTAKLYTLQRGVHQKTAFHQFSWPRFRLLANKPILASTDPHEKYAEVAPATLHERSRSPLSKILD